MVLIRLWRSPVQRLAEWVRGFFAERRLAAHELYLRHRIRGCEFDLHHLRADLEYRIPAQMEATQETLEVLRVQLIDCQRARRAG